MNVRLLVSSCRNDTVLFLWPKGVFLAQMVKNLPACYAGDPGLIPGLGRLPAEGLATHCSIPDYRIHEQRSPVGYSPKGLKKSDMTEQLTHFLSQKFQIFKKVWVLRLSLLTQMGNL